MSSMTHILSQNFPHHFLEKKKKIFSFQKKKLDSVQGTLSVKNAHIWKKNTLCLFAKTIFTQNYIYNLCKKYKTKNLWLKHVCHVKKNKKNYYSDKNNQSSFSFQKNNKTHRKTDIYISSYIPQLNLFMIKNYIWIG